MAKITQEQAIIITGYTETLCCKFEDYHLDLEKRLNRTVSDSEMPFIRDTIKAAYEKDFLNLFENTL